MNFAIVIAGASGGGKTSVAKRLISNNSELYSLSRSATSRPMREDDKGKNEYLFCSKEEFLYKIDCGDMVEYTEYGGNHYGTPKSELERIISEGKNPVLVLDMNGVRAFKSAKLDFPVYTFYVYEHINVIEQRLYDRDLKENPTVETFLSFQKRKNANIADYINAPEYSESIDAYIKNSELDSCVAGLEYCLGFFTGNSRNKDKPEGVAITGEEKARLAAELCEQGRSKLG